MSKIFVIGLQKTGTMSMIGVLNTLGYNTCKQNLWWKTAPDMTREKLENLAINSANEHDAFANNPWPLLYKELDKQFEDAKFILTVRESEKWQESAKKHFSGMNRAEFPIIYGVDEFDGNEEYLVNFFDTHNAEVKEHFADRPEKLLVVDITKNPGWEPFCKFLDKEIPDAPFPHKNKTGTIRQKLQKCAVPAVSALRRFFSPAPSWENQEP